MITISAWIAVLALQVAIQTPPPAHAVDREFLIGHWGVEGDCSQTMSFYADGTAKRLDDNLVVAWSLEDTVVSIVEENRPAERATVRRNAARLEMRRDSGPVLRFDRCAAVGGLPVIHRALPDSDIRSRLRLVAEAMAPKLPMQQQTPNGTIAFETMEAHGRELITTMTLPVDLDPELFGATFAQRLPVKVCENSDMRSLVGHGAIITYVVRDVEGERFTASVSSC